MNNISKEINELLLKDPVIQKYLSLKEVVENDEKLVGIYQQLDKLRKEICKDSSKDSEEYYNLLEIYKNDIRVKEYEFLKKEVNDFFISISEILKLN